MDSITVGSGKTVTVSIAQKSIVTGSGAYNVKDTLANIITESGGGSATLNGAAAISVTFASGTEVATLTGLSASAAPSAIDFGDDAATLTLAEFNALAGASIALTTADTVTLDAGDGDDVSGITLT